MPVELESRLSDNSAGESAQLSLLKCRSSAELRPIALDHITWIDLFYYCKLGQRLSILPTKIDPRGFYLTGRRSKVANFPLNTGDYGYFLEPSSE